MAPTIFPIRRALASGESRATRPANSPGWHGRRPTSSSYSPMTSPASVRRDAACCRHRTQSAQKDNGFFRCSARSAANVDLVAGAIVATSTNRDDQAAARHRPSAFATSLAADGAVHCSPTPARCAWRRAERRRHRSIRSWRRSAALRHDGSDGSTSTSENPRTPPDRSAFCQGSLEQDIGACGGETAAASLTYRCRQ